MFDSAQFPHRDAISQAAGVSGVWFAGLAALLAILSATTTQAAPPVASGDLAAKEKAGVTLYQASGLKGSIPLKKVWKPDDSGDTGRYVLEFASGNMNTEMQIQAKFAVPSGMVFKSFQIHTTNGPTQVTPAGADEWDGQTIIDKVTVSPWNMNRVLSQCVQQLDQGDGNFKDSATFDLVADSTEIIRGNGVAENPNAPPGSASSYSGTVKPRTRVTAYIVSADRKGADSREVKRVSSERPAVKPTIGTAAVKPTRLAPAVGELKMPAAGRKPQPAAVGELKGIGGTSPAKDTFIRTKPHVNVGTAEAARKIRGSKP